MKVIFIHYAKVANDAFRKLEKQHIDIQWEWVQFEGQIDLIDYSEIDNKLSSSMPFDFIFVADIFWKTGQNICKWCKKNNIKAYFLQHGQWIYTKNKTNPRYLPFCTFFFCTPLVKMVNKWPYGKQSILSATGTPRYDFCDYKQANVEIEDYVYMSPPVIYELHNFQGDKNISWTTQGKLNSYALKCLEDLKGLDSKCNLLIHPHYREGNIQSLYDLFPKAQFISPKEDPLPLIAKSKKVLTHRNSTVILDAIANGKITVLMNFLGPDKIKIRSSYPRGKYNEFTLESYNKDHLINNLNSNIEIDIKDNIDGTYIKRANNYIRLGNASKRIMNCIMKYGN